MAGTEVADAFRERAQKPSCQWQPTKPALEQPWG